MKKSILIVSIFTSFFLCACGGNSSQSSSSSSQASSSLSVSNSQVSSVESSLVSSSIDNASSDGVTSVSSEDGNTSSSSSGESIASESDSSVSSNETSSLASISSVDNESESSYSDSSANSSEASSLASSEPAIPVNNMLPIVEHFHVDSAQTFFSDTYKSLLDFNIEDPNNSLFYAMTDLSSSRLVVANGRMTIGNARFTIGQHLQKAGTHINPEVIYDDYKINTTRSGYAVSFPMTESWGDLDLSLNWKISFCVNERELFSGSSSNQRFMLYIDNNAAAISESMHNISSLLAGLSLGLLEAGKRVEINVPGDIRVGEDVIGSIYENPGTKASFIQIRVPSAGVMTMSNLWIGYQADISSEPGADTCVTGDRLSNWNIPTLLTPAAPTLTPGNKQLSVEWPEVSGVLFYTVAYNTINSLEGASLVEGIQSNSTVISNLETGTSYYVFVRAHDVSNISGYGPSSSGIPDGPSIAPETPTNLAVYGDNQRAIVTWHPTEGAESYSLALNTMNDTGTAEVTTGITDIYKLLTGLVNNTPYYVFVKAGNAVGDSEYTSAQVVTPSASPYIYQANLAVSKDLFFGTNGPALQTLGIDSEMPMHFVAGGNAGITLEEGGIRLANGGRFTIGQVVAPNDEGVLAQNNTAAIDTSVNGVLDLSGYYKIVINVVSASNSIGLFQVYLDNNTTSGASSIHQTAAASRLINRAVSTIADGEEIVYEMNVNHRGTSTSFIQLRVDSNVGSEGILISGIRIEEMDPPAASSSSEASSIAPSFSSSSATSSVATSESSVTSSSDANSSSSSSKLNGGTSSESSSIATSTLLTEAFTVENTTTFFSANYKAMLADGSKALYRILAGESRIMLSGDQLSLSNARFSIGDLSEGMPTMIGNSPNGVFDLSQPYRIKFTVLAAAGTGNFQVYVDNNTTGATNSIHSATLGTTASRLLQVTPLSIESFPYEVVIESNVGTPNSFFQIRADSNITNLVIDNLVIEYQ